MARHREVRRLVSTSESKEVIAMRERSWQRWQDWAAVVIGVLTALSLIVTTTDAAAAWTMVVLGVLLATASLWSLYQPGSVASEYVHGVIGVLLFVAPWVMS